MRGWIRRWLVRTAVALVALAVGAAVLVQSEWAARRGRDWLIREVATRWQLDLAASRLEVSLGGRRLTLQDVKLAAPGHAADPFFSAAAVTVTFPWAVFRLQGGLSTLEVDGARVFLLREGGTIVNLPPSSGNPPPVVPRRLDLDGVQVRGLQLEYVDRTGDAEVSVRDLTLAIAREAGAAPPAGPLRAAAIRVRLGPRETTSGAVDGRLAFDGSNVALQALTAPFPELTMIADGPINRVLDDVRFGLAVHGTFDVARVAEWTPPPVPVSGAGAFEGTFSGPLNAYQLTAQFTSPALRVARAEGLPASGTLTLTSPRTVIEPFRVTMPPTPASPRTGVLEGRFVYTFGAGSSDLQATFRDLDLDRALAAYDQDPLTFAAWEDGTVRMQRASPRAAMTMQARGTSHALTRAEKIAVDGTWTADLDGAHWRFDHDHRLLATVRAYGTMAWPVADDPAQQPLSGPLTLEIADVGPMVAAARQSGIDLSASLVGVAGPAAGTLAMDGSIARLVVRGRVASTSLRLPGGAAATAAADIVYDGDTLTASTFDLTTPGARVTGHVVMGMESGALQGGFSALADDLAQLAAPYGDFAALAGRIDMQGTIGGTTEAPDVPFRVHSTPIEYDGQRIGTVEGEARLLGTVVEVSTLSVDQGPGRVSGQGRVDYLTGAYDISFAGQDLSWANPTAGAAVQSVTARVAFAGAGTFEAPGGAGTLSLLPVGGSLSDIAGPTNIEWRFARDGVHATAFLPNLRTLAQATIEPRAPYAFRGTAAVSALDVQPLLLAVYPLPEAVSGTVGLSASFEGRLNDLDRSQAFVNLQTADLFVGGLPVHLERPARITARADDFTLEDLALRAGDTQLTASGRFLETGAGAQPLRATLKGSIGDVFALARAAGLAPAGVAMTGAVDGTWESQGGLERARATVSVSGATVTAAGMPSITGLAATASFDGAVLSVDTMTAGLEGATIEGRVRLPRAVLSATAAAPAPQPGRVDLTVRGLTQKALAAWLPAETIRQTDARVSATLGLDILSPSIDGLRGTLVLDEASVTAAGVPIAQARPAHMSIDGGTLTFDDVAFSAGTPVVISGSVTVGDTTTLDVTVTGTPGLRPFSVLSPSIAVDGAATVDLYISGTPQAPRIDGSIELDDAEVVMRNPQIIASDIAGPIVFAGDQVRFGDGRGREVRGFLNGGDFGVSGQAQVLGVDVVRGQFIFQARGVAVQYPSNVDSEIDALLTFTPGPGPPSLTGDVRVQRASYRAAISLPALLAMTQTRAVATQQAAPTYADRVRLDIAVTTVDDIAVDNNYGRFAAGADIRVQGTATRPGATGRVDLREGGELFVLGGLYRLNESSISLTNPATIEPDLNISAVTSASGNEDTLTLSGTLDRLSTTVTSSDPDSQRSALDVLLRANSLNREDALALLSGELLGVGRALGLDSLRVDRGYDPDLVRQDAGSLAAENINPATRLTLSKRLRPDVEVIVSQDLSNSGGLAAVVSYRPWRGLELRGTQRDNSDRNYAIRHQITFGGVPAERLQRRVLPMVTAVAIEGAPPADEPALRALLKLEPGDRFDFVKWREEIDRMQAWYRDRGRLEARVRADRSTRDDGSIALRYRVAPGPETALVLEGFEVSRRLRRSLEEAWTSAVFDRFLVDELRWLVQIDLVKRNLIGAVVDATLETPADGRKVMRIAVSQGRQASARRLRYQGQKTLTPAEFATQITATGLDEYIWMEPLAIVRPLTDLYYAVGHRHADIAPAEVVFEGDVAVLPVTIDEGPPTTLAGVTWTGVDEPFRDAVLTAARLHEGAVYIDASADEARRRIEALYRTRGYNNVVVTPRVTADDTAHTVQVAFAVEAGPQQRVAEIVVEGERVTRESAVKTALGLKEDAPVDFAAWGQARKRVYDTNVFRQVELRPEVIGPAADGTEAVRARVTVTEWPEWRLRYGLQLDDALTTTGVAGAATGRSQNLGVTADLQNRNVLGRAFTFGVTGRAERLLRFSSTYFTFPTLFGRPVQTYVFASADREDRALIESTPDFRDTTTQLSIEQRIRRGTAFQIAYGYRVKREILAPIDPDPDDFFRQVTLFGRFTASVFTDRRDNPFNARRGWFAAFNAERISEFESGDDTIKLLSTAYYYRTIRQITLASAGRLGTSFLDPLLFSERFYVGGANTVRGYAEDAAGPRDVAGFARGGDKLLVLNQELRVPLYKLVGGVAFVDAGNVFAKSTKLSFGDLQVGYGVGLRFDTSFSVFRIDVGWPTRGGGHPRWYFGLGQVF